KILEKRVIIKTPNRPDSNQPHQQQGGDQLQSTADQQQQQLHKDNLQKAGLSMQTPASRDYRRQIYDKTNSLHQQNNQQLAEHQDNRRAIQKTGHYGDGYNSYNRTADGGDQHQHRPRQINVVPGNNNNSNNSNNSTSNNSAGHSQQSPHLSLNSSNNSSGQSTKDSNLNGSVGS